MLTEPGALYLRTNVAFHTGDVIMNKRKVNLISFLLFTGLATFLSAGCTSASQVTIPPKYVNYNSKINFHTNLDFDYPSMWLMEESKLTGTDIVVISLKDPRFRTLPTPMKDESSLPPNDLGFIDIWISPRVNGQSAESEIEDLKRSYSEVSWIKILSTYNIRVDNFDAVVLEYETYPTDLEGSVPSVMFNRRIIIVTNQKIYKLLFVIAKKDRGGEFEKGYEYFFNSIEITP